MNHSHLKVTFERFRIDLRVEKQVVIWQRFAAIRESLRGAKDSRSMDAVDQYDYRAFIKRIREWAK